MQKIQCKFNDNQSLYAAYMPFIQGGALFVRVKIGAALSVELGEMLQIEVELPDTPDSHSAIGKVVWITPPGSKGGRPAGYGVSLLGEGGPELKKMIVKQISENLKDADLPTDTV